MKKLLSFLNDPPKSLLIFIVQVIAISLGYTILQTTVYAIIGEIVGEKIMPDWQGFDQLNDLKKVLKVFILIILVPLNSLIEESIFRVPLSIIGKIFPGSWIPFFCAIISSTIFGWIHGGIATIPAQGVVGMIFSLAYLKAGGNVGKFWKPMVVTLTIHTVINWILLSIAAIGMIAEMSGK